MENTDVVFDRILHSIGDCGKFQKKFTIVFVFLLSLCGGMAYMNLVLVMAIPRHWCHVPGRGNTTYSVDEWRNIHLPKEIDNKGRMTHSGCLMYNSSAIQIGKQPTEEDIVSCQYGYEYDKTWFINTISSSQDWVCEREIYITNVYAASRIAEVIGALTLGQLGDYIGRRPICLIAVIVTTIGKTLSIFTSDVYIVFLISCLLANFPSMTAMQSILVIAMEISQPEKRAWLAQIQNFGGCLSLLMMSLICWAIPEWQIFMGITSAPLLLFIFAYGSLIESPRWLAGRGKIRRCVVVLKKIAKANGMKVDPELVGHIENTAIKPEKIYGILSTFSSWRLAKNTLIFIIQWMVCVICYGTLILNTSNLGGNPFLGFFCQSLIELPAYLIGKVLCDKIGRRYTGCLALLSSLGMFAAAFFTARDESMVLVTNGVMVCAKCFISMVNFVITLQTMESYPTCLRQTGMSLGSTIGCASGALIPYVVFVGASIDVRFPHAVMGILCIIGAVTQLLLPETLSVKLPETLQEARIFGHDQAFFYIPRKGRQFVISEEIKFLNHKRI